MGFWGLLRPRTSARSIQPAQNALFTSKNGWYTGKRTATVVDDGSNVSIILEANVGIGVVDKERK